MAPDSLQLNCPRGGAVAEDEDDDDDDTSWPTSPTEYKLGPLIGSGSFSNVHRGEVLSGSHAGKVVALKITDLSQLPPDSNIEEVKREMTTMQSIPRHCNIITAHVVFTAKKNMWLVMPYMDAGSCETLLRCCSSSGIQDTSIIAYILHCTLKALHCLHSNDVMHRDLKSGNILLDTNGNVRLADFGVAASLKEAKTRHTFVGTPCWMAPEVLAPAAGVVDDDDGYGVQADVWSFAIAAIELLRGEAPYQKLPPLKAMMMILHNEPFRLTQGEGEPPLNKKTAPTSADASSTIDPLLVTMINACLEKLPDKRPTIDDLLHHQRWKSFWEKYSAKGKEELILLLKTMPPLEQAEKHRGVTPSTSSQQPRQQQEETSSSRQHRDNPSSSSLYPSAAEQASTDRNNSSTTSPRPLKQGMSGTWDFSAADQSDEVKERLPSIDPLDDIGDAET